MTAVSVKPSPVRRDVLARRVRLLVAATISYNVVEAAVALAAGAVASSTALIGFGLDSLIEVSSAAAVAGSSPPPTTRHGKPANRPPCGSSRCRSSRSPRTSRWIAGRALLGADQAEPSTVGLVLAGVSLAVMPLLSAAQRRAGRELGSASAVADSKQTLLCTYLSGGAAGRVGGELVLRLVVGRPARSARIAAVAVKEGRDAWRGDACCPPAAQAAPASDDTACRCGPDCTC